jgi:uncharacterized protein
MSKSIYVSLPVKDLSAATRLYEAIGCKLNPQFSDHQSSNMIWSDAVVFHLMQTEYFASFTPKSVADAKLTTEVMITLGQDSREAVDRLVEAAASAGGKADPRPVQDMDNGFLYNRAFEDVDGHVFEAFWADLSAMPSGA